MEHFPKETNIGGAIRESKIPPDRGGVNKSKPGGQNLDQQLPEEKRKSLRGKNDGQRLPSRGAVKSEGTLRPNSALRERWKGES